MMNPKTQSTQKDKERFNEQVISALQDIREQNNEVLHKIDHLETTLTKKATMAGAVAGTVSGSIASGVLMVGLELLKAKFGG